MPFLDGEPTKKVQQKFPFLPIFGRGQGVGLVRSAL